MAGGGGAPVRRTNHSAICAGVIPSSAARASDAVLTTYLRPPGEAAARGSSDSGQLVGDPGQFGVDEQVRPRRVEGQGDAVLLDGDAPIGRMAVVPRTARPDPVGGDALGVLDQEEAIGDRGERLRVVLVPGGQGLVAFLRRGELDQGRGGVEGDLLAAAGPPADGVGHERRERRWLCRVRVSSIGAGVWPPSRPKTIDSWVSFSSIAAPILVHQANRESRPTSWGVSPWR